MTNAPPPNALTSRTFIGLLVAQFLAAFNDQAIHAAAMFYAINTHTMTEGAAISLMPVLFYAPWAIFCTAAGHLADRYSKRSALVTWKFAEVAITVVAAVGFWMGRNDHETFGPSFGPWLVLATVFLMGTHSAFFVPAKYGIMPEILPPDQLSKGNGLLESLSFLAVILGTVTGGVLSYYYLGREVVIGVVLVVLAVIGAVASLMIHKVPAANPTRPFPPYLYGPIVQNLRTLFALKPLRLAVIGIAFFTFVVAFMRAAVYMLGESQNPRWDELKTSAIVGTVALGIGLGSPLAGWLSGRRVELRLVPLGALGMITACLAAANFMDDVKTLVVCIVGIGFFTGFYIVPLFTLLQHKAPKTSKGDMIATSNFINITGAISASVLFYLVLFVTQQSGLVPKIVDRKESLGELVRLDTVRGRPVYAEVVLDDGKTLAIGTKAEEFKSLSPSELARQILDQSAKQSVVIEVDRDLGPKGSRVKVSRFEVDGVAHYDLGPSDVTPAPDYDQRQLPRFLFIGAAVMTLMILFVIWKPLKEVRRENGAGG
jgi:MFS family permease